MKTVIFYWTRDNMYYVTDTDGESMRDTQKRLNALCNNPGVISGVVGTELDIPDFAIDATPDYDNL